ncbi:MAG TPA: hypothetical protein PKN22_07890, partial [Taishania sp.]|nr:hypothetical protein [Taishania sp.]
VPYNKTIFKNIESIKAIDLYTGVDITPKAKEQGKLLIESLIKDIERFGLEKPEPTEKESFIRVDVNQTNQQTQSTTVSINIEFILEILKGELRNSEIEELKEILDSSDKPKEKKNRFIEKIKSFGSDVASNILANLLTNPQVYENLGKML